MGFNAQYKGAVSSTRGGQSGEVWGDIRWDDIGHDPGYGFRFFDDFISTPAFATTVAAGGLYPYIAAGSSIPVTVANARNGILALTTQNTDNAEVAIGIAPDNAHGCIELLAEADGPRPFGFETRVAFDSVAVQSAFFGLLEPGRLAALCLRDEGDGPGDYNYIGFLVREHATACTIDAVYRTTGGTGEVVAKDDIHTIVAATSEENDTNFVTLGLYFDGVHTLKYVLNGAVVAKVNTGVTQFPDGNPFVPMLAVKTQGNAVKKFWMDWIKVAQHR